LVRKKRSRCGYQKFDGEKEAHLIALACSSPPLGEAKWTTQLLADKMVELNHFESISDETIRQVLKKNELKPWLKEQWCIPPQASTDFVCAMEDILEVYQRSYSAKYPLICLDETSKQLFKETRLPISALPGKKEKYDFEYERQGVNNIFMIFAPLQGFRHVKVTNQRTKIDLAICLKEIVDVYFQNAQKITLVMDNLNTHKPGSLYNAFSPMEARRIIERLEFHYTPKHGSWLNMAEIELSVLQRQCLDRRIPDQSTLIQEVTAWEKKRNTQAMKVDWRFTTKNARIKLKRLYPVIKSE